MPLTPCCLIAAAASLVGLKEEGGNNRGLMIELFLKQVAIEPGEPWCAAFVYHVGYHSHVDAGATRSSWPLPATASCYMLGQFAKRHDILKPAPQAGDVFLVHDAMLGRFAHTGIIVRVDAEIKRPTDAVWYDCTTIEGNTNEKGSREGNAVARKSRRFYPEIGDRFVRWVDLEPRGAASTRRSDPAAA